MKDLQIAGAQADMRAGYISGAPGIAVSAVAWLAAASVALFRSPDAAVWTLLVAGASWHWVEQPIQEAARRRTRRPVTDAPSAALPAQQQGA